MSPWSEDRDPMKETSLLVKSLSVMMDIAVKMLLLFAGEVSFILIRINAIYVDQSFQDAGI